MRDPHRHAALHQKHDGGEGAGLGVEAFLEIFVSGVDAGSMEDGHGRGREDHHGDGQPEIELHEAHAVDIACPVVAMKVMALACVAMIERPMAYQGMVLPASR